MKQLMKKSGLLTAAVIAMVLLLLAGCSQYMEKPSEQESESVSESEPVVKTDEDALATEAFDNFMNALITFDLDAMRSFATVGTPENAIIGSGNDFGGFGSDDAFGLGIVRKYTKNISYTVTNVVVDGDTATVSAEFNTPDIENAMPGVASDILKDTALKALTQKDFDMNQYLIDYVENKLSFDDMAKIDTVASVNLVKQDDGSWLVENDDERNADFVRAVTGGAVETMEKYADMLP